MLQLFRPLKKESRSLELLRKGLKICYTLKDVAKVKEVLQLHYDELRMNEVMDFSMEINYRISLIEIVLSDYPEKRYSMADIALFFKNASYAQADALLLHVDKFKENYRDRNEFGYDIFIAMWVKRKEALKVALTSKLLHEKVSVFIKTQLLFKQIFGSKNQGYQLFKHGYE